MNSKIRKIIKGKEVHLTLFNGYNTDGRPLTAFIVTNGNNLEKLAGSEGEIILGEYGKVLYSEYGHEVSELVVKAVINGFRQRYLMQ